MEINKNHIKTGMYNEHLLILHFGQSLRKLTKFTNRSRIKTWYRR